MILKLRIYKLVRWLEVILRGNSSFDRTFSDNRPVAQPMSDRGQGEHGHQLRVRMHENVNATMAIQSIDTDEQLNNAVSLRSE